MTSKSDLIAQLTAEQVQAKLDQQNQVKRAQNQQLKRDQAQIHQQDAEIEQRNLDIPFGNGRQQAVSMLADVLIAECRSAVDAQIGKGPDPISDDDRFKWLLKRANEDFREFVDNKLAASLLKYMTLNFKEKLPKEPKCIDEAKALSWELEGSLACIAALTESIADNQRRAAFITDMVGRQALAECAPGNPSALVLGAANIARAWTNTEEASLSAARIAKELARAGNGALQAAADVKVPQAAGRLEPQVLQSRLNHMEIKARAKGRCPNCGNEHAFEQISTNKYFLRHLAQELNGHPEVTSFACPIVQCSSCGAVFSDRPKEMPLPYSITAGVHFDSKTAATLAMLAAMGLPANRTRGFLEKAQVDGFASEVFNKALQEWLSDSGIGSILVKEHVRAAQEAGGVIVMDELPYKVLEAKGQDAKDDGNSASLSTYVACITSPHYSQKPFAVYVHFEHRSDQSIAKALNGWTNIDAICIDDDCPGCDTTLRLFGKVNKFKVSRSLAHWRRMLFESLNLKDYDELAGTQEGRAEIRRRLENGAAEVGFIAVVDALRKIYVHEGSIVRKPGEDEVAYLDRILQMRRSKVKPLIEEIDLLMNDLGARYAKKERKGWVAADASPYAKGVVYWLNHREDLCRFLDDARLSPETNGVERCMRAVAVARRSSFFKQTNEFMDTQCNAWTLRETAKLNGIKDTVKWLDDFHRAFFEHCERMMLLARYASKQPGKSDKFALRNPHITAEMISCFDFAPWLAWNYASKLPTGKKSRPL